MAAADRAGLCGGGRSTVGSRAWSADGSDAGRGAAFGMVAMTQACAATLARWLLVFLDGLEAVSYMRLSFRPTV